MAKQNPALQPSPPIVGNKREHKHFNILSFLNGSIAKSWEEVEKHFHKQVDHGKLFKENFGGCIGENDILSFSI